MKKAYGSILNGTMSKHIVSNSVPHYWELFDTKCCRSKRSCYLVKLGVPVYITGVEVTQHNYVTGK